MANLADPHSYRGYYSDLAFEFYEGTRPAANLLAECRECMGQAFTGYKGGEYVMGTNTPIWVSEYGNSSGDRLISVSEGGAFHTQQETE